MRGKVTAVVGTKWGDEGKGKIIDFLAQRADVVARATGGSNAGHRVVINGRAYPLHLLPSGVFNSKAKIIIGNGVLVDPVILYKEIKALEDDGFKVMNRLYISEKAQVVLPYHPILDAAEEKMRTHKIGTTKRGIGPAAQDKYARWGISMGDFLEQKTSTLIQNACNEKMKMGVPRAATQEDMVIACELQEKEYVEAVEYLKPCICDTISLLHDYLDSGENILIEGAQATLLDIDVGTRPYVTSSNPIAAGMCVGIALGPTYVSEIIGVTKAYESRVGEGPFPTEEFGEDGKRIREWGHEYGTTTGRPRRCGWQDLVALRYACRVNGLTGLAVNHLDTIGKFKKIKVCIGYRNQETGKTVFNFNANTKFLEKMEPIYEEFDGDFGDISHVSSVADLPESAWWYLQYIANYTGVPIRYIGVGPSREDLIECDLQPMKE